MKAKKNPTAPTASSQKTLRDAFDEMRNCLSEAQAFTETLSAVAALTELSPQGLTRLRHLLLVVTGALADATGLADDLGQALAGEAQS